MSSTAEDKISSGAPLSQLNGLRSAILRNFNLSFTGAIAEWRKPEPNRVSYSIDGWPINKLRTWEINTHQKWISFEPHLKAYLDCYNGFYTQDFLDGHSFFPPWCEIDRPEDQETNESSVPPYIGQVWWSAMIACVSSAIASLVDKKNQLEAKYAAEHQEKTEGTEGNSLPERGFDAFWPDLSSYQKYCKDYYWQLAILEALATNAPNDMEIPQKTKDSTRKVPIDPVTNTELLDGRREFFRIFDSKLLHLLIQYENSQSAAFAAVCPCEEAPWSRKVKQSLESLLNTMEMWQSNISDIQAEAAKLGEKGKNAIFQQIPQEFLDFASQIRDRIAKYDWNSNGAGWSADTAKLLRAILTFELTDLPKPLETFFGQIAPCLVALMKSDELTGSPIEAAIHPQFVNELLNLNRGSSLWSRDQWRALSWPLDPQLRKFRDQFRSLKAFFLNGDFPIADSACNAFKAAVVMWENAGNDYWFSDRFVYWTRTIFLGGVVLEILLLRGLDGKRRDEFNEQFDRALVEYEKIINPEGAVKKRGSMGAVDLEAKIDELINLTKRNTDAVAEVKGVAEQAIDAVINSVTTGYPSCILIIPNEPRATLAEKLRYYEELLYEKSTMHVMCEFACCKPGVLDRSEGVPAHLLYKQLNKKLELSWHLTSHGGFPLEKVKHKEFLEKAGTAVKITLIALSVATKIGGVFGVRLDDPVSDALGKVQGALDGLTKPTAGAALLDYDEKSPTPFVQRRLEGSTLEMFKKITGIVGSGDSQVVGGVQRAAIRKNGPMGRAGTFYWLCEKHYELVKWWNESDDSVTEEEFFKKLDEMKPPRVDLAQQPEGAKTDEPAKAAAPSDTAKPEGSSDAEVSIEISAAAVVDVKVVEGSSPAHSPAHQLEIDQKLAAKDAEKESSGCGIFCRKPKKSAKVSSV